ncbi:pyridoxal 5'-phosphate synthase glutaminase subunit PdxT [Solibacillus sp. FSL H8-0538]|uniref:pyridoxal 5'-phosphate synthase glutaminase subunit PdxT n=1 Tax=Solibacillus sp. FSL H8-0538 TaxID=2921400 RepID=UPI0030F6E30E
MKIGVLALQGAVAEHAAAIKAVDAQPVIIKHAEELAEIDGLLLPGGESTAMRKLIDFLDLLEPLQKFAAVKPVFGTCAGLILLAKQIEGQDDAHIGAMNISVSRNSFGRQVDSFEASLPIENVAADFPAVFIRAPKIEAVSEGVKVLAKINGEIVCAQEGHLLGCSFHPELTTDVRLMEHFKQMIATSLLERNISV